MHELYLSNSSRIPNSLQRDLVVEVTVAWDQDKHDEKYTRR